MLVAILDADKEGFLRSRTSLIQTIGRAARNVDGKAVLYADSITKSMKAAIDETDRRREKQVIYNTEHGITPESVRKGLNDILQSVFERADYVTVPKGMNDADQAAFLGDPKSLQAQIKSLEQRMRKAASDLEFEEAAELRDRIKRLEAADLGLTLPGPLTPQKPKKSRRGR